MKSVLLTIFSLLVLVPTLHSYRKSGQCSYGFLGNIQCSKSQIKINGVCKPHLSCPRRFYLKNGFCQRCSWSCKSCVSSGVCSTCVSNRVLHNGKCIVKCPRNKRPIISDSVGYYETVRICATRKQEGKKCSVGQWSEWGVCGTVGGPNTKTRTRSVGDETACAGVQPIEYITCHILVPNNEISACVVSEWFPWEQCDPSCKSKFRKRRRIVEDIAGGLRRKRTLCPNLVEEEPCPCLFETQFNEIMRCDMAEWTEWSECNAPCGPGTQTRVRKPRTSPQQTKMHSCRPVVEKRKCCEMTCQDYCSNSLLGAWSDWGKCEGSCDKSVRRRVRSNIFNAVLMFCDVSQLYEEQPCRKRSCGREKDRCVLGDWGEWSECQLGTKHRDRKQFSGSNCPELADSQPCPS